MQNIAGHGRGWLYRVLVVDNASGDGSVEAIRAKVAELGMEQSVDVLDVGRNSGFGGGNNFGAAAVLRGAERPELLWFLNPDTRVAEVDLAPALEWFRVDPLVGVVGTGLIDGIGEPQLAGHREILPIGEFVRTGGGLCVLRRFAASDKSLDRPGQVDWVSGASLLIRRSTFQQLQGFDEGFFLYFEEVDLCRRARLAGWKVVYEPRVRVVHLEGQSTGVSAGRARPSYWYESRRRYFVKHFGRRGLIGADIAWALGRAVGGLRGRAGDGCHLRDLWRYDMPIILGRERLWNNETA